MRIASDLAGFTMGEADVLRKAMGKKIAAVMEAQREKFLTGAVERGPGCARREADLGPDGVTSPATASTRAIRRRTPSSPTRPPS